MAKKCVEAIENNFGKLKEVTESSKYQEHQQKITGNGNRKKWMEDILKDDDHNQHISNHPLVTKGEMVFAIRHCFCEQAEDLLTRRFNITYLMKHYDKELVLRVAKLMAEELNKQTSWVEDQQQKYFNHWLDFHPSFLTDKMF
jgi:glycerol-3-phosphate dehydrogenase